MRPVRQRKPPQTAAIPLGPAADQHGPASIGIQTRGLILCAHADQDRQGMHWKLPGQACTATAEPNADTEASKRGRTRGA